MAKPVPYCDKCGAEYPSLCRCQTATEKLNVATTTSADILRMVKRMAQEYREQRKRYGTETVDHSIALAKCAVLEDVARAIESGKVE